MRKLFTSTLFVMAGLTAMADETLVSTATTLEHSEVAAAAADTAVWTFPGSIGLNVNQSYFNDFCVEGGGFNASLDAFLNLNANYKKKNVIWENSLMAKYGMMYSNTYSAVEKKDMFRKSLDELILDTKFGYKIQKNWYASAFINMETQMTKSYNYNPVAIEDTLNGYTLDEVGKDTTSLKSNFFAPGYVKASLGFDYIPNKYFSAFISPTTLRMAVCRIDELGGEYGMEHIENAAADGNQYKHVRADFGAYFKLKSDFDINEHIHFFSSLEGFWSYNRRVETYTQSFINDHKDNPDLTTDQYLIKENPFAVDEDGNLDMSKVKKDVYKNAREWYLKYKLELTFKLTKNINMSFRTQLKYDYAEKTKFSSKEECFGSGYRSKYDEGKQKTKWEESYDYGLGRARVQFWEATSIGLSYSF